MASRSLENFGPSKRKCEKNPVSRVTVWAPWISAAYHSEVGLLQFPSSLLQPLGENGQLRVLPPQPPDLLLRLWGAALPLNTWETKYHQRAKF